MPLGPRRGFVSQRRRAEKRLWPLDARCLQIMTYDDDLRPAEAFCRGHVPREISRPIGRVVCSHGCASYRVFIVSQPAQNVVICTYTKESCTSRLPPLPGRQFGNRVLELPPRFANHELHVLRASSITNCGASNSRKASSVMRARRPGGIRPASVPCASIPPARCKGRSAREGRPARSARGSSPGNAADRRADRAGLRPAPGRNR